MTEFARPTRAGDDAVEASTHRSAQEAGGLNGPDALLTLQRSAGNQAVTHLMRQVQPRTLQRKLSYSPAQLNAERSVFGRMKGARTKDTLYQITETLRLYHRAAGPEAEKLLLITLTFLCKRYKQRHPLSEKSNAKASVVDDLEQAAWVELWKLEAMEEYHRDVSAPMVAKPGSTDQYNPKFPFLDVSSATFGQQATEMKAGTGAGSDAYRQTTKELLAATGISEAELAAIKIFVGVDFKYINPATANSPEYLAKQRPEFKIGDEKLFNRFRAEGGLHAAVAMSGLAKLPTMSGLIYRGTGEAPGKIAKPGDVIPVRTIQSWSQDEQTAANFTSTSGGDVRVVYKLNTTKARNINSLKGESIAAGEPEWVLMPGNSYRVDSIEKNVKFGNYRVIMVNCTELT
jgi:hypothetical protein